MMQAVILTTLVAYTAAYPEAAPVEACGTMLPVHGAEPMTSTAPYEITVSGSCYKSGTTLRVTVASTEADEYYFEGFMIQARVSGSSSTTAYGSYDLESDSEITLLDCSGTDNAIGHNAHDKWIRKTFTWTAGSHTGDLKFMGTVVKGKTTFWTEIESSEIAYDASCTAVASDAPTDSDKFDSGVDEGSYATYVYVNYLLIMVAAIFVLLK